MSRSVTDPRLCFNAEHFETLSGRVRNFQLLFFFGDQTVELTDLDTRKCFLKRCECKNLIRPMFYVGAEVVVFGRLLKLVSYGDGLTKQLCQTRDHKAVCILGGEHLKTLGAALTTIQVECAFAIRQMVSAVLPRDVLASLGVPDSFADRTVVVLVLVRERAAEKVGELARRLGRDVWASASDEEATRTAPLYDTARKCNTAIHGTEDGSSSVVVVKQHVVAAGEGGEVIRRLTSRGTGLAIAAVAQITLSGHEADAFFNAYKGVLEDYRAVVEDLSCGNIWVLQLIDDGRGGHGSVEAEDGGDGCVVARVRGLVGPFDPVIAKALRPQSIRAVFGLDRVHNAVHCTDLPRDAADDAEFIFSDVLGQ